MSILIKGGRIIDALLSIDKECDLLIDDGLIRAIDVHIDISANEVIDASGKWVLPGLVDMHCHLREPGYEAKETIFTGTRSAAVGGFTSIACMPNTFPAADNKVIIEYIRLKARSEGAVKVYPIGCITKGRAGKEISEFGTLKQAGAIALSDDGNPVSDSRIMMLALKYAMAFDLPIISHCEDTSLSLDGVVNEGVMATHLGLKGIPSAAEEVMVARDVILAKATKSRVHIAHVSTAGSVEIIRQAKRLGIDVTCETCPHYFSLTDEMVSGYNTAAKVNPPLRSASDVQAICSGLKDGTIDVIATDHAPHAVADKDVSFDEAAAGISGFETALAVSITHLVHKGVLTPMELVEKMALCPAKILGLDAGTLVPGRPADVIVVDPYADHEVRAAEFISKGKNSPYDGMRLKGNVLYTLVDGQYVVYNGRLV